MNLSLNNTNNTVLKDGTEKQLTSKEFGILSFLMDHPDEIHTAEEIYENVWKEEPFRCRSIICVHICHIREKLESSHSKKNLRFFLETRISFQLSFLVWKLFFIFMQLFI